MAGPRWLFAWALASAALGAASLADESLSAQ